MAGKVNIFNEIKMLKIFEDYMRKLWTSKLENDLRTMYKFEATAPNRAKIVS